MFRNSLKKTINFSIHIKFKIISNSYTVTVWIDGFSLHQTVIPIFLKVLEINCSSVFSLTILERSPTLRCAHTVRCSPCQWGAWLVVWLLAAGPGPCWTVARWELCKPALSPRSRRIPPSPAPHRARPDLGAGDSGTRARILCCLRRCRASSRQRGAKKVEKEGQKTRWKHREETEAGLQKKQRENHRGVNMCLPHWRWPADIYLPLLCLATGITCTVKLLWSRPSWFLSILRVIISE